MLSESDTGRMITLNPAMKYSDSISDRTTENTKATSANVVLNASGRRRPEGMGVTQSRSSFVTTEAVEPDAMARNETSPEE